MSDVNSQNRIYFANLTEPGRKILLKIEEDQNFQLKTVEAWSLRSGRKAGSLRVSRTLANPSRFNANLAFGFSPNAKLALESRRYY